MLDRAQILFFRRLAAAGKGQLSQAVLEAALPLIGIQVQTGTVGLLLNGRSDLTRRLMHTWEKQHAASVFAALVKKDDIWVRTADHGTPQLTEAAAQRAYDAFVSTFLLAQKQGPVDPLVGGLYYCGAARDLSSLPYGYGLDRDGKPRIDGFVVGRMWVGCRSIRLADGSVQAEFPLLPQDDAAAFACPALWTWLYRQGAKEKAAALLAAEDAEQLNQTARPPSAKTMDNTGLCAICERRQKLSRTGAMVLHGYERPGTGFITGNCFGTDYPPLEISHEACGAYIKVLEHRFSTNQRLVDHYRAGTAVLEARSNPGSFLMKLFPDGRVGTSTQRSNDPTLPYISSYDNRRRSPYQQVQAELIGRFENENRQIQQVQGEMQQRIDTWQPRLLFGQTA